MAQPDREETLALAAVFQALAGVHSIAGHGRRHPADNITCLRGLLDEWPGSVERLYGGVDALDTGLRSLAEHLSQPQSMQLTRYLVSVMQLDRRLGRQRHHLGELTAGLERAREQARYFGALDHPSVLHNLAGLYSDHVSPLRPRILVQGQASHLQDSDNAAVIRALLLAAIRAAGLWRAAGGGRIRLVLQRRQVVDAGRALLARI